MNQCKQVNVCSCVGALSLCRYRSLSNSWGVTLYVEMILRVRLHFYKRDREWSPLSPSATEHVAPVTESRWPRHMIYGGTYVARVCVLILMITYSVFSFSLYLVSTTLYSPVLCGLKNCFNVLKTQLLEYFNPIL